MKRRILFYGEYFLDFYSKQDNKTKEKIDFVLDLIRHVERVPVRFLKYLEGTDGLYEIRVKIMNNNLRIFCFFDEGNIIILINGFTKKQSRTPKSDLEKGRKLKKEYFLDKHERQKR